MRKQLYLTLKKEVYYHFMNTSKVKMAGYLNSAGKYIKGIRIIFQNHNILRLSIGVKWLKI